MTGEYKERRQLPVEPHICEELNRHAANNCQCRYPEYCCRARNNCAWTAINPLDGDNRLSMLHRQARDNSYREYRQRMQAQGKWNPKPKPATGETR